MGLFLLCIGITLIFCSIWLLFFACSFCVFVSYLSLKYPLKDGEEETQGVVQMRLQTDTTLKRILWCVTFFSFGLYSRFAQEAYEEPQEEIRIEQEIH